MKTQPKPTELDNLINWLRLKPTDGEYTYHHATTCLLAEYYSQKLGEPVHMGAAGYYAASSFFKSKRLKRHELPDHFNWIARGPGTWVSRTYGEALQRALLVKKGQTLKVAA